MNGHGLADEIGSTSFSEIVRQNRAQELTLALLPRVQDADRLLEIGTQDIALTGRLGYLTTADVEFHQLPLTPPVTRRETAPLPFEDDAFDTTILVDFDMVSDPRSLLAESLRVSSDRVLAITTTPAGIIRRACLDRTRKRNVNRNLSDRFNGHTTVDVPHAQTVGDWIDFFYENNAYVHEKIEISSGVKTGSLHPQTIFSLGKFVVERR